mmetsp:Transcript_24804/g.38643  ORF Transcript_24804/g.38643 Transcript_24804/m.38643 type:complete len:152 (-) Transcript_24804:25-480(-)
MSSENDEAVNLLLTQILKDRFCLQQNSDLDACVANYVPQNGDGSYVEQSLQRKGLKICEPYSEVLQKCMHDEKKQRKVMQLASQQPECKGERSNYFRCQRVNATSGGDAACEREAREMLMCGLAFMIQKQNRNNEKRQQKNSKSFPQQILQ